MRNVSTKVLAISTLILSGCFTVNSPSIRDRTEEDSSGWSVGVTSPSSAIIRFTHPASGAPALPNGFWYCGFRTNYTIQTVKDDGSLTSTTQRDDDPDITSRQSRVSYTWAHNDLYKNIRVEIVALICFGSIDSPGVGAFSDGTHIVDFTVQRPSSPHESGDCVVSQN